MFVNSTGNRGLEGKISNWVIRAFFSYTTLLMVLLCIRIIPGSINSALTVIFYAWGLILVALLLIKKKPFLPRQRFFPMFCILVAFFLCFGITIVLNHNSHFADNIKGFVSTGIQLFVFFYLLASISADEATSLMRQVMCTLVAATLFIAATNVFLYVSRIDDTISAAGRIPGIFANPNNVSVGVLSLLCSLFLLRFKVRLKWIQFVNIALQIIVIVLCDSRGATIMLALIGALFALQFAFEKTNLKKMVSLLLAMACMFAGVAIYKAVETAAPYLPWAGDVAKYAAERVELVAQGKGDQAQGLILGDPVFAKRDEQNAEDSTLVRINMLGYGWGAFLHHPLLGVGPRNVAKVVATYYPLANLNGISGGGLHNTYLQLLVSDGLAGVLLILLLMLYCLRVIFSRWKSHPFYALAMLAGLSVYGFFESNLIFVNFPTCLIFWSLLGYTVNIYANANEAGKHIEIVEE